MLSLGILVKNCIYRIDHRKQTYLWDLHQGAVLELQKPTVSTYLLEVDWATRSTNLCTFKNCVHCTSVCQSRPLIRR